MKKAILKIMLGTVILEALLVCVFILIGDFDDVAWQSIESVGIIFGYSIPCLFYSKIYDDEKYKYIAITGSGVVCITTVMSILSLWDLMGESDILVNILGTLNVVVWSLTFISWILSFISVNNLLSTFKKISITLILLESIFTTFNIWAGFPEDFFARLYYVLMVLTVCAFICTLILTRIYRKEMIEALKKESDEKTIDLKNNPKENN